MSEGPTILWGQLKGKKVKSNDGKNLGEIDKVSQNYIRLEKGKVKKKKFWIPKYFADTYDGKEVWLLETREEVESKFRFGKEPPPEQLQQDLDSFKKSERGRDRVWDPERLGVRHEKVAGVVTKPKSGPRYKNIRELK